MASIGVVSRDATTATSISDLVGRLGDRVQSVRCLPADLAALDLVVARHDEALVRHDSTRLANALLELLDH